MLRRSGGNLIPDIPHEASQVQPKGANSLLNYRSYRRSHSYNAPIEMEILVSPDTEGPCMAERHLLVRHRVTSQIRRQPMRVWIAVALLFALSLVSPIAHGQTTWLYTDLHDFGVATTDGQNPAGGVTFDRAGNMYGTVSNGGINGAGMVWEITTSGAYKDLHDFGGTVVNAGGTSGPDGRNPWAGGVTFDSAGNMYGTTQNGGPIGQIYGGLGMVWEITASGTYKDLHDFGGTITNSSGWSEPDGAQPFAGVTFDSGGNMYGTTWNGGPYASPVGGGIVWEITASGTYKDLHDFGGNVTNANGTSGQDGLAPVCEVSFGSSGSLYGTASGGGPNGQPQHGDGMVWELTASGIYKDLHDFGGSVTNANGTTGPDGELPYGGVTFDSSGNMYGTTGQGGSNGGTGMVWEITSTGTYKDLHDFGGTVTNANGKSGMDGAFPAAGIKLDGADLYGTTDFGGSNGDLFSGGIAWEITASGTYKDLHDFGGTITDANGMSGSDGSVPFADVAFDSSGDICGTTQDGGANGKGIVWRLATRSSLESLAVSPSTVMGGAASTGTVTLTGPAPNGGLVVSLASSSSSAAPPPAVTVAAGKTTATFTITTSATSTGVSATITASQGSASFQATLLITPPAPKAVTITPASVTGGSSSTGTVTLGAPSPTGGEVVSLSSSNPSATLPASVTVTAGKTSATFTITTSAVSSSTPASITASVGNLTASATLTVTPAVVSALTLSPTSVVGGTPSTGTITLNGPAPADGAVVSLTSSNSIAAPPSSVTIAAGASSANFKIVTSAVGASTAVTINAIQGTLTKTATLTIKPAGLSGLTLSLASVVGGIPSTATITLNGPAPTGGTVIALASSSTSIQAPASVTIPAGGSSATTNIATTTVVSQVSATITATLGSTSKSATLTVNPLALTSLSLVPTAVTGGVASTGTVALNGPAGTGGAIIVLSGGTPVAGIPPSVTVPAGQTSATFSASTSPVAAQVVVPIKATYQSATRTANLTVNPAALLSVNLSPTSLTGGSSSAGTVTLTGTAPTGGLVVKLSSNSAMASLPASVNIAAGQNSATFTVKTEVVTVQAVAIISSTLGTDSKTAGLTINPPSLASITVAPSAVVGLSSSTGTATLSGAAPAGGIVVNLSTNQNAAVIPATVTIPAGKTSATFTVKTVAVPAQVIATLTGTQGAVSVAAKLTINPPPLISVVLKPTSVVAGNSSTGTVSIRTAAPTGGLVISLSSSDASATVPATTTILAGNTSATFTIKTTDVSTKTTATITATSGGESKTAVLTISP